MPGKLIFAVDNEAQIEILLRRAVTLRGCVAIETDDDIHVREEKLNGRPPRRGVKVMRGFGLLTIAAAALSLLLNAADNDARLNGIWMIDTANQIKTVRTANQLMRVEKKGSSLLVIEVSRNGDGKGVWSRGCTLDDRVGRSLVLTCNDRRETWTLSKNGHLLLIERTVSGCDGCVTKEVRFKKASPNRHRSAD